jgi:hypothetical protein
VKPDVPAGGPRGRLFTATVIRALI